MAHIFPIECDLPCPREQMQYAVRCAEADAERVIVLLLDLGIKPTPGRTCGFSKGLLLDFAAMLRLRTWENARISVHREEGLPSADEAFDGLVALIEAAAIDRSKANRFGELSRQVIDLSVRRFIWAGPESVQTDVVLCDEVEEDALIDALAQFLWANRRGAVLGD